MDSKEMTQQEFSQFLEMSPASLSSIFTGRTNPTLNVVESIKKKFDNINLDWLMFGNGPMFMQGENGDNADSEGMDSVFDPNNPMAQNQTSNTSEMPSANFSIYDTGRTGINTSNSRSSNLPPENNRVSDMKIINNVRRKIKEIRVFYDDQTYESFVPKE